MYVDVFAGNLEGVRKKLDYIEECGVNYLHLMPLIDSPEGRSDGGYAIADFRKVKAELGTMEDLEKLLPFRKVFPELVSHFEHVYLYIF